jgi:hypothetical protein
MAWDKMLDEVQTGVENRDKRETIMMGNKRDAADQTMERNTTNADLSTLFV